jgi:hypothetical protein
MPPPFHPATTLVVNAVLSGAPAGRPVTEVSWIVAVCSDRFTRMSLT